ncbi:MAG: outer membrane beta-barrel protein [bacterium]|nr:outer membrane beta-barrel protein [bacterium]
MSRRISNIFLFALVCVILGLLLSPAGRAAETPGIYLRPLTFHPLVKIKYGYDTNVFRRSTEILPGYSEPLTQVSSGFIEVIPEIGLESEIWNWALISNVRIHLTYYQDPEANRQSTTSYPEFNGDHIIRWKSSAEGLNLDVQEKWKLTSDPIIQDVPEPLGGERVKRFYNQLVSGMAYTSRSGFFIGKLQYDWERNQYRQRLLEQMNYSVHSLTFRGENRFLPKTAVSLALRYRNALWDTQDFGRDRNYDSLNLSGCFNGQITEKLASILSLGYEGIRFRNGDFSGQPVGTLEMIYKPTVASNVNLRYQRSTNPSITSQTYVNNVFEISAELQGLRPRGLGVSLGFEFDLDQYEKLEAKQVKLYHSHAGIFYQFGGALEWLKLGLEYEMQLSRSNQPYYVYDAHQIGFWGSISY